VWPLQLVSGIGIRASGLIRATKKRIEELEAAAQVEDKEVEYYGFKYVEEDNRAQFIFAGKPDEKIRAILKDYVFKCRLPEAHGLESLPALADMLPSGLLKD